MRLFILIGRLERFSVGTFPFPIRFYRFHKLSNDKAKAVFVTQFFIMETVLTGGLISTIP